MKFLLPAFCLLLASCAQKPTSIHLNIATPGPGLQSWTFPLALAQALGHYKDQGLHVDLSQHDSEVTAAQALNSGQANAAALTFAHSLRSRAENQPLRSFFLLTSRDNNVLLVAPSAATTILRIPDLKASIIGVPDTTPSTRLWLNFLLARHGLRPIEFTAVSIGSGAASVSAIEAGRVDAAALSGGEHFHILRRNPKLLILADTSTPEGMRDSFGDAPFAAGVLCSTNAWLQQNPDSARRLTRALQSTMNWIATHSPQQILDQLPPTFRSSDPGVDLDTIRWATASFTRAGVMPPAAPTTVRNFLDSTIDNFSRHTIPLQDTWTNDFLPSPQ